MKLDIEAMATEAKMKRSEFDEDGLEAFARLIVERCAAQWESDNGFDKHGAAAAIRNLLGDE